MGMTNTEYMLMDALWKIVGLLRDDIDEQYPEVKEVYNIALSAISDTFGDKIYGWRPKVKESKRDNDYIFTIGTKWTPEGLEKLTFEKVNTPKPES